VVASVLSCVAAHRGHRSPAAEAIV